MKVYVWESIEQVAKSFNAISGGLVVFAETEADARELANSNAGCNVQPHEFPDDVRDCHGGYEKAFIFPSNV